MKSLESEQTTMGSGRIRVVIRVGSVLTALLVAAWAASQSREAPQLILLGMLTIITANVTIPMRQGGTGLLAMVSVSSLLILGMWPAALLFSAGLLLAELLYPFWEPLWQAADLERESIRSRAMTGGVHLVAMLSAGAVFQLMGGTVPLTAVNYSHLQGLIGLSITYGTVYCTLRLAAWLLQGNKLHAFPLLTALLAAFLSHPFAFLGSSIFLESGMAAFVVFCLGLVGFSMAFWLWSQQRRALQLRFEHVSRLNDLNQAMRETLDISTVLDHMLRQVGQLVEFDRFSVMLTSETGDWVSRITMTSSSDGSTSMRQDESFEMDDFSEWVAGRSQNLDLDSRNLHFAEDHNLTPPFPLPAVWFGVPLMAADKLLGIMVLQRYPPHPFLNRWNREVLLAIAGQASASIHNAQLYGQTVRMFNRTDDALAQRVEQLHALIDAIQEGVMMINPQGEITLINKTAAALLQQEATAVIGSNLGATDRPGLLGYGEQSLHELLQALQMGQVPSGKPIVYSLDRTGGRKYIRRAEAAVMTGGAALVGWLMIFRDITEEQSLAEMRDDMTRMIVHDLRNPLTTLASTIELIGQELAAEPLEVGAAVTSLLSQAQRYDADMLDMVDSLMDISQIESGKLVVDAEAMHLGPLLTKVVGYLQPLALQKNITLQAQVEDPLPPVWADEEITRRVLVNLLDNALKFTPSGGLVECRLETVEPESNGREPGVKCVVSDTGPGIPEELGQLVFDRYMRTNQGGAQVRGTGLGLTFCKLAVEAHDGRIWVENNHSGGSSFALVLPGLPVPPDSYD